jgi:hypothetical protein
MILEEIMSKQTTPSINKKIIVDSAPNIKKHPTSEVIQAAKISIPQSFKDYLKSLDNYHKKLTDDRRENSKKQGGE